MIADNEENQKGLLIMLEHSQLNNKLWNITKSKNLQAKKLIKSL